MGLETIGVVGGLIGAGASTAGSIYNAAQGGNKYNLNAAFPQMQQQYLDALKGSGGYAMSSLTDLTRTGGANTSIAALTEALGKKQAQDREKGTANILEQFGSMGMRYSSPVMSSLADFESTLSENYGNILANYVFNATEGALNRKMSATSLGVQAMSAPALTMAGGYSTPGAGLMNMGSNIASIGTYLGSLGKRQ